MSIRRKLVQEIDLIGQRKGNQFLVKNPYTQDISVSFKNHSLSRRPYRRRQRFKMSPIRIFKDVVDAAACDRERKERASTIVIAPR